MINKEMKEWLNTPSVIAPSVEEKIFKIPVNERFWAIYSSTYTDDTVLFTDIFDVKFVCLWDVEEQQFLIKFEEELLNKIEILGLGDSSDVAYLPDRLGTSKGMEAQVINKLDQISQTYHYTQLEAVTELKAEDLKNVFYSEIEDQAVWTAIQVYGAGKQPETKWKSSPERVGSVCYLDILKNWNEKMLIDILSGKLKVFDMADQYVETHEQEIYKDLLLQSCIDERVNELINMNDYWVARKIELLQLLNMLKDEGCRTFWIYFVNSEGMGTMLKANMDETLENPVSPLVKVGQANVDVMTIFKVEWKKVSYFEHRVTRVVSTGGKE